MLILICVALAYTIDNVVELPTLSLQTLTSVVSIISAIILLAIALTLHNIFSGSQALIDKQTHKVLELLHFISSIGFAFDIGEKSSLTANYIKLVEYKTCRKDLFTHRGVDSRTFINYAHGSLYDMLHKLSSFADDPYVPKSIATIIRNRVRVGHAKQLRKKDYVEQHLMLGAIGEFPHVSPVVIGMSNDAIPEIFTELYQEAFDADDMMYRLEIVYSAAYKWTMQHNRPIVESLNLEPVQKFNRKEDVY